MQANTANLAHHHSGGRIPLTLRIRSNSILSMRPPLQTMVNAAIDPDRDRSRISANVLVAPGCPDQAPRTRQLARLLDLFRSSRTAAATSFEHPVRDSSLDSHAPFCA